MVKTPKQRQRQQASRPAKLADLQQDRPAPARRTPKKGAVRKAEKPAKGRPAPGPKRGTPQHNRQQADVKREVIKSYTAGGGKAGSAAGSAEKAGPSPGGRKSLPAAGDKPPRTLKPLGKFQKRHSVQTAEDGTVKHAYTKSPLLKELQGKWEKLRMHATPAADRARLAAEILAAAKGSLWDLVRSPVGSRILQSCAKHGGADTRAALLAELQPHLLELAKAGYGHFLVRRLLAQQASPADMAVFLKAFRGHVGHLLRHPCGSAVIDELYHQANAQQRNLLAAELYGKEFALFPQDAAPAGLAQALAGAPELKRQAVLARVAALLHPLLEKGMVDPPLVHRLLAEYMAEAPRGASGDLLEALGGPLLLRIVHTQHGAQAACNLFAWGAAKDKKKALKAFTGDTVWKMAKDEWAHLVLLAALAHTDDTALLHKTLLPALQADLGEFCGDRSAMRIPLGLLRPRDSRVLPPALAAIVYPPVPEPKALLASPEPAAPGAGSPGGQQEGAAPEGPASSVKAGHARAACCLGEAAGCSGHHEGAGKEDGDESEPEGEGRGLQLAAAGADEEAEDSDDEDMEEGEGPGEGGGNAGPAQQAEPQRALGPPKKDPLLRRREILGQGEGSFGAKLCEAVAAEVGKLLRSQGGADLVKEVASSQGEDLLAELQPEGIGAVREALVALVAAELTPAAEAAEGGAAKAAKRALQSYPGGRAVLQCVQSVGPRLADPLWGALQGHVQQLQGSKAEERVLAAVWRHGSPAVQKQAGAQIKRCFGAAAAEWAAATLDKPPEGPPGAKQKGQGKKRGAEQQAAKGEGEGPKKGARKWKKKRKE